MNDTPTIRARIHESAIKRVTRMFAATLADAFTEILQNARRAGARRVHVAVAGSEGNTTVTVTDDGAGIVDPGVLLIFAENGWSEDLVAAEDAAGMGMLSLARRGCTVSSRPRTTDGEPAPGWRVDLAPEHFLGEAEAEVRTDDDAPYPHGTAVTFRTTDDAEAVRAGVGTAAWHYPLPVVFEHAPDTPAGGEQLERRAFLDGALHAERWRGLVFGVFKDRWAGFGLNDPDVNFHGLTVSVRLPSVETVTGARWSVAADIVDCPRAGARAARAQGSGRDPVPRRDARGRQARDLPCDGRRSGSAPRLRRLEAGQGRGNRHRRAAGRAPALAPRHRRRGRLAGAAEAPSGRRRCTQDGVRARAAGGADLLARRPGQRRRRAPVRDRPPPGGLWLVRRDPARRQPPHGSHRRWAHLRARLVPRAGADPARPEARLPARPDAICISLAVRPAEGPGRIVDLPTDLAFAGEAWSWVHDALPLVAADSILEPWELAQLLRAGFFSPSDDADADSWERQRTDFEQEALHLATRLLCSDDQARITTIADAVARELFWLIPHDRGAEISVRDRKVTVTLGEPVGEAA